MLAISFAIMSLLSSAFLGYVFVQFHREIAGLRATRNSAPLSHAFAMPLRAPIPATHSLTPASSVGMAPDWPQPAS